jgi:hypothetical protein
VNNINRTNVPSPSRSSTKPARTLLGRSPEAHGEKHGYRNSQVTVLAPTGTIGFMMDCDTTGIEPDLALVKYKKLVGGGMIKIVNNTVPTALFKLGYTTTRPTPSSATSTPPAPSKARPPSRTSTCRLRLLLQADQRARGPSTTWDTCA